MHVREFWGDRCGSVAVIAGLLCVGIVTVVAVSITSGDAWSMRSKAQAWLDQAVLAGAALTGDPSDAERVHVAELTYAANRSKRVATDADVQVLFNSPAAFSVSSTVVSGEVKFDLKSGLLSVLGRDSLTISVISSARIDRGTPICVLGLDPTEDETIDFNGQAEAHMVNCAVMANSSSGSGIHQSGHPKLSAADIGVTGGFKGSNFSPEPVTGVPPIDDPYASLIYPIPGACHALSGAKIQQTTLTLTPGTYCGGLSIKSSSIVTMQPGEYIFKDGSLQIDSKAVVSGQEVVIFFIGADATLLLQSGASLTLSSPTSGPYTNFQFIADRALYGKKDPLWFTVLGDAQLNYDGIIYTPSQHIWFAGGSTIEGRSPNYLAIARKIWFQDNTRARLELTNSRHLNVDAAKTLVHGATLIR